MRCSSGELLEVQVTYIFHNALFHNWQSAGSAQLNPALALIPTTLVSYPNYSSRELSELLLYLSHSSGELSDLILWGAPFGELLLW